MSDTSLLKIFWTRHIIPSKRAKVEKKDGKGLSMGARKQRGDYRNSVNSYEACIQCPGANIEWEFLRV